MINKFKYKFIITCMVNYVSDFICTYNLIDDLEDSELLFRTQLLQAFIPKYLEKENKKSLEEGFQEIDKITEELFNKYGSNKIVKRLMEIGRAHV